MINRLSIPPTWGIRVIAVWSLVLALLAVAHLLVLSAASAVGELQTAIPIWVVFLLNALFVAGFGVSAVGLWRIFEWGRRVFLGLIILWSVFNFASLAVQSNTPLASQTLLYDLLRYVLALVVPLIYLNLPNIRHQFIINPTSEVKLANDNSI
jgi:hypothetical protein